MDGVAATGRAAVAPMGEAARRLAFATLMLAFAMDVVDSTVVNTALPAIQADLRAGGGAVQWVVASYFLSFALLLVAGGRLGDLYGYRRMFLLGVAAFTGASLVCGLAGTADQLVAGRLAQGAAAAIMAPQVTALVQLMFTPLERVSRLAVFGLVGGVAAIGGPILGGLLIEADLAGLGWRLVFLINLPVGLAAMAAGWRLLPEGRSPYPLRLDWPGVALLGLGLLALLLPLIEGRERGWPWWSLLLLAAAPALLAGFWGHAVRRTRRLGSALIAPELFGERTFALGVAATLFFAAATTGFLLVLSLALQQGLGYSALDAALAHLPFGLGVMAGISLIGRRALPSAGRLVPIAGAGAMIVGVVAAGAVLLLAPDQSALLLAALLVAGIGMGMIAGPLPPITLARVDRGHAGAAGAIHKAVQQIGGAVGGAAAGGLFFGLGGERAGVDLDAGLAPTLVLVVALLCAVSATAALLPRRIFD